MSIQKQEWFWYLEHYHRSIWLKTPLDIKGYQNENDCEVWSETLQGHGLNLHTFAKDYDAGVVGFTETIFHIYDRVYSKPYHELEPQDRLWRDCFDKIMDKMVDQNTVNVEAPTVPDSQGAVGFLQLSEDEAKAIWSKYERHFMLMMNSHDRRTKDYRLWRGIVDKFYILSDQRSDMEVSKEEVT